MKNTYSTSDVAKLIGIHPNTVRLYEDLGLITRPERKENGYRIFTDFHLIQFRIARPFRLKSFRTACGRRRRPSQRPVRPATSTVLCS